METFACIFAGLCLIGSGIALFRLRPPDWQSDGELEEAQRRVILRWTTVQRAVRLVNNCLLIVIGATILTTIVVPRGQTLILIWAGILLFLLVCILLAMIDAFSSVAGYRRAVPEAARRAFRSSKDSPPTEQ